MRRPGLIALVLAVLLGITACAIPVDTEPRPVRQPPGPFQALASPSPPVVDSGAVVQLLYYVKGTTVLPVERRVDTVRSPESLLRDLLAGPTASERAAGITSALPGTAVISTVRVTNGVAHVTIVDGLQGARNDEVLAFAQIVCTLDARTDIVGVTFTRGSNRIDVPAGDGSLTRLPLTTSDYRGVLAP